MRRRSIFLTAAWRQLALLNFPADPTLLSRYVPQGTELDFHEGETYLSIVGFSFQQTAILGLPAVGHGDFSEVNLRFYVRRKVEGQWRRGVVFIQEIVSRPAVTWIARTLYGENYVTRPMQRELQFRPGQSFPRSVEYRWLQSGKWNCVGIDCVNQIPQFPQVGSLEEFIIEHYWGYTRDRRGRTREYEVEHPAWEILPAERATWSCDVRSTYGSDFAEVLSEQPGSAFLSLGSEIAVRWGSMVKPTVETQPETMIQV